MIKIRPAPYTKEINAFYKDPENSANLVILGEKAARDRRASESLEWFEKSLELEKDNFRALNGMAKAYLSLGLFYSSKIYFEKALKICPDDSGIRRELSRFSQKPSCKKENVTFYVPCFNAERFIAKCLGSILSQSYPIKEILVIDDCSTDATRRLAGRFPVRIIKHKKNKGLSSARNTALKNSSGDFIASIDADVVLDRYWLEYLMLEFSSGRVGGGGGRLIEQNTLTVVDRWRQINMTQNWGNAKKTNPYALFGCDTVYRKKSLLQAGGYNEKFANNHEDTDISLRVKMLKYSLVYNPRAKASHLRSDDLASVMSTFWRYFRAPAGEIPGYYVNFETLKNKLTYNFNVSSGMVAKSLRNEIFHLLYPDILCGFWNTLEDIVYLEKFSRIPKEIVRQTFLGFLASIRYLLAGKKSVSGQLEKFILNDLKVICRTVEKEDRYCAGLAKFITSSERQEFKKRYKKLKSNLVHADFEFINAALRQWKKRFKISPLAWKMAEVSARRIDDEKKNNPLSKKGPRLMLVNPPWRVGQRYGVRAGSRWPLTLRLGKSKRPQYLPFPFFMAYSAALAKKNGINTVVVDAIAENIKDEELLERVRGFSPDLLLIEAATASIQNDLEWARKFKGALKNVKIVFAGTHVSALADTFLIENPLIDYLIKGEYEFSLSKLALELKAGKKSFNIPGIFYRDKQGGIKYCKEENSNDINRLPLPERLSLPIYNYNDSGGTGTPSPTVQLMSSRGCPFGCIFCLWPQVIYGNRKYRFLDPVKVVDEMEVLIKEYGFKGIYFDDDTFNIGKQRVLKICGEIRKRKLNVPWAIMARADTSDFQTLRTMKEAGLCALKFGVESSSQRLLDNSNKGLDLSAVERAVEECKKLKIRVHLTFTLGLPGETAESIDRTIGFALKLDPDSSQFSLTTPFPGTEYFNFLSTKRLLLTRDWKKYDGNRYSVIRTQELSAKELEAGLRRAQKTWNEHCMKREFHRHTFIEEKTVKEEKACEGKIAIVDLLFNWPPLGGASSDIKEVGAGLAREGYSVQMFVPFYNKLLTRGQIRSPLPFPVHQLQFKKATFTPEIISRRIKEAVDNFDPDYVLLADGWSLKPYVLDALKRHKVILRFYAYENLCLLGHGNFSSRGFKCPYNFLNHREKCLECVGKKIMAKGLEHFQIKELLLSRGLTKEFHSLVKRSIAQAHGIIVYNQEAARILRPFNRNVYVVPGGVRTREFYFPEHERPRQRKNILMTGRVDDEEKGLSVLVTSCKKLWQKRKDFLVNVTSRRKIDKPFIRSTGWLPFDSIPRLYRQADICVFPSLWPEPFGLVAVEAMSAARPVIASNTGGLKEVVVDGVTGFLVKPGDSDELAEKIDILLEDGRLRKKMGRNGRKRAEEKYEWEKIMRKYYLPLFKR